MTPLRLQGHAAGSHGGVALGETGFSSANHETSDGRFRDGRSDADCVFVHVRRRGDLRRTNGRRGEIRRKPRTRTVFSKTSGKFKRTLLLAGCDAAPECYAKVFHAAIKGCWYRLQSHRAIKGSTLDHTSDSKDAENRTYLFKKDLLRALSSEFKVSGDFKKIVVAFATKHPSRIQETISDEQYEAEVNEMYVDAVKGICTDESKIIQLLCNKTPEQIEEFKFRYQMKYTEMLKDRLKVETTGIFENKYFRETIQGLLTNREEQIAVYLKEAFGGWLSSNDDWGLISMLVHRNPNK